MPVIVNSILNEHQIIVDIVAFVQRGDFPRSRLGEKQRGKILAGWVSRKMRTIAQFAIRDTSSSMVPGEGDATPDGPRTSYGSFRSSSGAQIGLAAVGSTLRNVEPAPQILEQRELEQQLEHFAALPPEDMRAGTGHMHNGRDEMTPTGPRAAADHGFDLPDFNHFDTNERPPGVGPKPNQETPEIRLPEFQSGGQMIDWRGHAVNPEGGASGHHRNPSLQDDEDWTANAIAGMSLADRDAVGRGY